MAFHRSVEMSISREEFLRLLRSAVPAFDIDGDAVRWFEAGRLGTIRLAPLTDRQVGSAALPRHRVDIVLESWAEDDGESFMQRFHRAFLRGGG